MNIINIDIADLTTNDDIQNAVEAIGADEYTSRFNAIFNDVSLAEQFKSMLSEQMLDTMDDWKVVIFNGGKAHAWLADMALATLPEIPVFTNCVNGEPYLYIDMTVLVVIPDDIREVTIDYMLIKEGVHREQILRGDLVTFDGTLTWKGVTYTQEQIHTMAHEKTEELMNVDGKLDEKDIMILTDCQHEWEREATVRTLAGLTHVYEMNLSTVQRTLVDDWVKEQIDMINARTNESTGELETPVLNFEVGTNVSDIKEWFNALFMCDVNTL